MALYPQKLWQTSPKEELDYSLVACQVPQGIQVCRMPYAICRMPYAVCRMPYAVCRMPYGIGDTYDVWRMAYGVWRIT